MLQNSPSLSSRSSGYVLGWVHAWSMQKRDFYQGVVLDVNWVETVLAAILMLLYLFLVTSRRSPQKFPQNRSVTCKFYSPGGSHKASSIHSTHNSGVSCKSHSYLSLSAWVMRTDKRFRYVWGKKCNCHAQILHDIVQKISNTGRTGVR
jgi:hypothetical protein